MSVPVAEPTGPPSRAEQLQLLLARPDVAADLALVSVLTRDMEAMMAKRDERRAAFVRLREKGVPIRRIAHACGISDAAVQQSLASSGMERVPKRREHRQTKTVP